MKDKIREAIEEKQEWLKIMRGLADEGCICAKQYKEPFERTELEIRALAALKEIEEVDVSSLYRTLTYTTPLHPHTGRPDDYNPAEVNCCDVTWNDCLDTVKKRGMLRAGVEHIEGLEEALAHDFQDMECSDADDSAIATMAKAARKYLAMDNKT